jgi:DnaJ family protein C protein 8
MDARLMVLKQLDLPFATAYDDPRLANISPSWDERVRQATKELMVDDELRRRKAIRIQHQAEGEVQRKKEQAVAERKRKAEHDAAWESTRDHRVADWRAFQKNSKKKKKADANVLG